MTLLALAAYILVGAFAGWLASMVVEGHRLRLVPNMALGGAAATGGGRFFETIGMPVAAGVFGALFAAFVGSVLILFLVGRARRAIRRRVT